MKVEVYKNFTYIHVKTQYTGYVESEAMNNDVVLDYDESGELVGIEIMTPVKVEFVYEE